ncbi:Dbl homology domain-containing protein, partial [Cladochytrium replicatum]
MNGAGTGGGAYLPQAVPRPMATSLFQQCVAMIEKLYRFPLFDRYLFPSGVDHIVGPQSIDPVQILLDCFRLGAPLALLYNHLQPVVPIEVPDLTGFQYGNYQSREKKPVMKFLIAIKNELDLSEEEKSTILSDLYADNTNQFVKFIRIVEKLIARIEQVGLLPPPRALPFELPSQSTESPSDNRSKLVAELIETERKYIEDLEFLQKYQNMLFDQNVLAKQKKYDIFCNLDAILDFQRRFLIMLEGTLALPPSEQRIGQVFVNTEEQFRVYEIYCANYDISVQHVAEEQETLMQLQSVMDPVIQLPSYLIKPVQRLLKYPLFLTDLIKFTDKASEAQQEDLKAGLDTVKRVGEHINEQKRRDENRHLKQDLVEKMEDWKNLNPDEFGELLLTDKFSMRTNDTDREYFIFLFERMLICCKDAGKKTRKSRGLTGGLSSSAQQPSMNVFQLRGNIDIRLVERVVDTSKPEQQAFGLKVLWRDGKEHETFVLKCRNMEQVKLWSE